MGSRNILGQQLWLLRYRAERLGSAVDGLSLPPGLETYIGRGVAGLVAQLDAYEDLIGQVDVAAERSVARHISPYRLAFLVRRMNGTLAGVLEQFVTVYGKSGPIALSPEPGDTEEDVTVDVYLGDGDREKNLRLLGLIDDLAEDLGYDRPTETSVEWGSVFRRAKAAVASTLRSREVQARLATVELAAQNYLFEERQAAINLSHSEAFEKVMSALEDQPEACVRIGSLLILKFRGSSGPVTLTRMLSATEIQTLERYPGIQREPSSVLQNLAAAIAQDSHTGVIGPTS